jgi:hypothetical protein
MSDPVNHPKHYNQGEIECIQAIKAALGDEGFRSYCQGNAMKYLWRYRYKGKAEEDIKKCQWYLLELERSLRGDPNWGGKKSWNEEWSHD